MSDGSSSRLRDAADPRIDPTRANSARFWNELSGGKDGLWIDRELVNDIRRIAEEFPAVAAANHQFLIRACGYLVDELGIDQYLYCGPGRPLGRPLHDVVQGWRQGPDDSAVRVQYVESDPASLTHARAHLITNNHTQAVYGDLFGLDELLHSAEAQGFLDWSRPIAVLHSATLHHCGDLDKLTAALQTWSESLAPGSYTVISHFLDLETPGMSDIARRVEKQLLASTLGTGWFRTAEEIRTLFPGQDLLAPGIVPCHMWPTAGKGLTSRVRDCIAGGVGRKPSGEETR